jgi:hypothetical protein
MPRAGRWLVYLAVACVVAFAIVQPVIDRLIAIDGKADGLMGELGYQGRARSAQEQAGAEVRAGMAALGVVAFPGEEIARSEAFNRRVNEVLAKNSVKGGRTVTRKAPLVSTALDAVAGEGRRIDRLIMDLQFDATPEQVAAVIADLESTPEVAAVSRVQLRRESGGEGGQPAGRTVRANLTAEAWLLARKEGGR